MITSFEAILLVTSKQNMNLKPKEMAEADKANTKAYVVNGILGNTNHSIEPIMHFSLVIEPKDRTVSGIINITHIHPLSDGDIVIKGLKGRIMDDGLKANSTQKIALEGVYLKAKKYKGLKKAKFSAELLVDNTWSGRGRFSFGSNKIEYVPVQRY